MRTEQGRKKSATKIEKRLHNARKKAEKKGVEEGKKDATRSSPLRARNALKKKGVSLNFNNHGQKKEK